jgi:hypothetical protein
VSSRATSMTTYLENGGTLGHAQQPFAEGFGLQAACRAAICLRPGAFGRWRVVSAQWSASPLH